MERQDNFSLDKAYPILHLPQLDTEDPGVRNKELNLGNLRSTSKTCVGYRLINTTAEGTNFEPTPPISGRCGHSSA